MGEQPTRRAASRRHPGLRRWAAMALSGALLASAGPAAVAARHPDRGVPASHPLNPVTSLTAATFANPPQNDMPWVRWNFPPATSTIAELQAELQDMADHNIGGVEIGQGGVPTNDQLIAILGTANALGIKVSLKVVPNVPVGTYTAADPYARRTLGAYRVAVNAGETFGGALPGPASGNPGTIVAVLAYACTASPCATTGTVELDRASVQDLTSTLTGTNADGYQGGTTAGTLTWTAPAAPVGGQWVVLTIRAIPFGNGQPETLSLAGTKELTDAYDQYFAGGLGALLATNGGGFFVDSHATDPWGAAEELWSSGMQAEFQARAGYDIVPNLAALFDPTMTGGGFTGVPGPGPYYSFSDGSAGRIRSDFNRVRSDMFTEYRLEPFQAWAHTWNMPLRLQMEDGPFTSIPDQLQTTLVLDRPEYESLTGSDQTDIYRPMASANHMDGNTWYSTECCAVLNESYVETYQDAIIRMNHEFAGGVTRLVYHIYPYLDTPATTWPGLGFSATSKVSFSNAWNRTEPYWIDAAAINDYFARNTQVLTQGAAKMDVAVYMRSYSSPAAFATTDPSNRHWQDTGLQRAGYTWDYVDEAQFALPNAVVTHRRLAENGPAYKALIFDQLLYPTSNTARGGLTLEAARTILGYARAGLPVIFVGQPTGTAGMPATDDAALEAIVAQILAQRSVSQVATEADVPARLASLGIQPQARPAAPSTLLSVRRSDAASDTDYYYLYDQGVDAYPGSTTTFGRNPSNLYEEPAACRYTGTSINPCMATGSSVDTLVTLEGRGAPYLLDAFTGAITPIVQYTRQGNSVTVRVSLARDASTIIAISNDPHRFGTRPDAHVTSTTADAAVALGGSIAIRATSAGTYTTVLDHGRPVQSRIGPVPAAIDLTAATWHVDAEDWQPANPYGTTGADGTLTNRVPVSLDLAGLRAWPDIPELANASGVATYTTSVTLPAGWNDGYGATLSLGQVTDTFTLTVNGRAVAIDQIGAAADIGRYLRAGANTISVRVATTLNNRLAALDAAVRNRAVIQNYGIVGPVVMTPYRQAIVWGGR